MTSPGAQFRDFPRNVRLLLMSRLARSIGQGLTVASFALYLHALGFGGAVIGAVLTAGLLIGAALTAVVGPLSDRTSRRVMLLAYEIVTALAALVAMLSRNESVLIVAAIVAGFGRGGNGAAGPFSPVEQAWIAREVEGAMRRRALSVNATIGFLGMAVGSCLALLPTVLGHGYTSLADYRLLFAVPLAGSLAASALIALTREDRPPAVVPPARGMRTHDAVTMHENRQLRRLALANATNGFGIGIIGPLIAYWLMLRFGQGLSAVGPGLALSFVLAAIGSVLAGRMSIRFGTVRAVLWMRGCGIVLLAAMPFSPMFSVAVALYAARAACNRGTLGPRQAVTAELTRAERRGLGASVQNLSLQIPRAIGPLLGGWLIHQGDLAIPFFVAAALQTLHLVLYAYFFRDLDRAQA